MSLCTLTMPPMPHALLPLRFSAGELEWESTASSIGAGEILAHQVPLHISVMPQRAMRRSMGCCILAALSNLPMLEGVQTFLRK